MDCVDADVVAFLNADEEKENNEESNKPNINDLLLITDAAVQALDKPGRQRSSENNRPLNSVQPVSLQFNPLSPNHLRDLYGDGELDEEGWTVERTIGQGESAHSKVLEGRGGQNDTLQSRSSTASEILIRSTMLTPRENNLDKSNASESHASHGLLDASVSSRVSATSDGRLSSSGFVTGQAKKVKLSSKKLKEIKSPFESFLTEEVPASNEYNVTDCTSAPNLDQVGPPIIDINENNSNGKMTKHSKKSSQNYKKLPNSKTHNQSNNSPTSNTTSNSLNAAKCPKVIKNVQVECHVAGDKMSSFLAKKHTDIQDRSMSELSNASDQQVYRDFKNDMVITDVRGSDRNQTLNLSQSSSKKSFNPDLMATTSSKINAETASNISSKKSFGFTDTGSMFIEDVIAGAGNETSETPSMYSEESAYGNPEILTIPQSVVTITAQDQMNGINTSGSDTSADNYPLALQDRFGKYRPSGVLRQGAPVEGSDPQKLPHSSDSDVTVTQYGLSDKQRQLRSNFMKRNQSNGPHKRVVHPKVIPTATVISTSQSVTASNVDPVTTAAVAASAAVAATQPFLRAQQEVEHRMAEILEKLSHLQGTNPTLSSLPTTGLGSTGVSGVTGISGGTVNSLGEGSSGGRVLELEKQLQDLTQRRLDYLEKMHEKQVMVQAQLLSISRQPAADSSESDSNQPSHWPSESRWKPSSVTKPKQAVSKTILDDGYKQKYKNKVKDEREVSVLDTPAPRKKPPTPMSFDGTGSSEKRSPVRSNRRSKSKSPTRGKGRRSPERQKKKAFGLLEEILSSQDETPRHSPFASTPPDSLQSARIRSR